MLRGHTSHRHATFVTASHARVFHVYARRYLLPLHYYIRAVDAAD